MVYHRKTFLSVFSHFKGKVFGIFCTRRECWYTPLPCGAPRPMSFCGVPDTFCCAVLLGNFVVYRVCGFRVCSRVWDRFYLSPSPLLISRWGGCSIEQQEETGQALFFLLPYGVFSCKSAI